MQAIPYNPTYEEKTRMDYLLLYDHMCGGFESTNFLDIRDTTAKTVTEVCKDYGLELEKMLDKWTDDGNIEFNKLLLTNEVMIISKLEPDMLGFCKRITFLFIKDEDEYKIICKEEDVDKHGKEWLQKKLEKLMNKAFKAFGIKKEKKK